ncbi:hypothetical protein PHYSODRAFT_329946 [Phytophthora sojae]|uniref:Ubiquitin-like protease family profile domain-containing protein n=1 Tax=Phytophthora sojae (strain P6497) TaxID=1094619 RepID=G4ZBY7_PHYSP|nr:hypothetical protein PHYSODRAFT_329946 [Phytophthora sojae]EGZ22088.1 hypothetical protein PHYSODRAFT_329946 [Phytophthora sojae]|eukprot:XP_009524805.1 hypothetical protein PHYSODRAFT_329946 [Phytophthora sojae]
MTPYYYEPLCSSSHRATMEDAYNETVAKFIRDWHTATMSLVDHPVEESRVWLEGPKQPDGTSCGMLCIAQAYAIFKDSSRFVRAVISQDDGAVMRLRVMWMILMQPDESTTSNKVAKAVQSTDIELIATITT